MNEKPAENGTRTDRTLLIYAPVPLFGETPSFVEKQASNGLRLWADNFERLIVMMPHERKAPPRGWVSLDEVDLPLNRIELHALPTAYRPDKFVWHLPATRRKIRQLISRADYIGFSIGGLFGDWGSVSSIEAHRLKRPYFVWTDRVESEVVRRTAHHGPWRHRLRKRLTHRPMAALERYVIRRAALGLFHGKETFDAYAPFCRNPHVVHDIHISKQDHISEAAILDKASRATSGPLKICYLGRADPMKGPFDWLQILEKARAAGVDFTATWMGDGPKVEEMRRFVERGALSGRVAFPGFVEDRQTVLAALREAHVFLFCHKTPESPRCLIEALASGCPLVGYDGAFVRDLISQRQGGVLVDPNDRDALADALISLDRDRDRLRDLIARAAQDGAPFNDVDVFKHRSDIIKENLGCPPSSRS